jgi:hypothetical protein
MGQAENGNNGLWARRVPGGIKSFH